MEKASTAKHEHEPSRRPFSDLRHDFPASVVVALVALPLCLGIAIASGAPPMAGLVTGIVGGIVVAWLSGASLAVSGPAAGLTVVVIDAIHSLGYEGFLLAVMLAGAIQVILGFARLGIFGYYIPNAVIRGMLAAIGLILILKQIPHAVGFDKDYEGDLAFIQDGGENTFSILISALGQMHVGAVLITILSLSILLLMPRIPVLKDLRWLPAPLVAVLGGIVFNRILLDYAPEWAVAGERLVMLPVVSDLSVFMVAAPDFSQWTNLNIYTAAGVLAVVASIETILCVEAVDKLDPFKRITPTNRELKAQGVGNIIAGFLGGIPMTAVIVRGSANVHSGGRTQASAFLHGVWLLLAVWFAGDLLRSIPLATLAGVLLVVGYKLAPISIFSQMYKLGAPQFLPFISTVVGILVTDLLMGICIGLVVAIFYILKENLSTPYFLHHMEEHPDAGGRFLVRLELSENVSFLNKAAVNRALHDIREGAYVEIDGANSRHIHHDVLEIIHEFVQAVAPARDIEVKLSSIPEIGSTSVSH
ncbi:MAG: SulP family inorganic anion transporter [Myxococcales bacterium]|nr:SulP family inorganic anion transporter [Myxococcales bacterium]